MTLVLHLTFTLDMATIGQAACLLAWKVYQLRRGAASDASEEDL